MDAKLIDLKQKLWNKRTSLPDNDNNKSEYLGNISISLSGVEHCITEFLKDNNPEISIIFAKALVMELWNIRSFLIALNYPVIEFDKYFPRIKELRDSYAHIDERIIGNKKINIKSVEKIKWEQKSLANGSIISNDGRGWTVVAPIKRQFNMTFSSVGVMSIFGIFNNYLICNSSNTLIEFEISPITMTRLVEIIEKACA
jgi:hypothetical protein